MKTQPAKSSSALLKECQSVYDWWSKIARGKLGVWLMFGWALAEATFWPVIPDFLLVLLAVAAGRYFPRLLLAATTGSFLGAIVMFLIGGAFPEFGQNLLGYLPLVHPYQLDEVRQQLATNGISAFIYQPWSGIQSKIWAVIGGMQDFNPWLSLPVFGLARAFRMAVVGAVAWAIGSWQRNFFRNFSIYITLGYFVLFFYEWWQIVG